MTDFPAQASASILTKRPERYAKQLLSHWGRHAVTTTQDAEGGTTLEFADGERWQASAIRVLVGSGVLQITAFSPDTAALAENTGAIDAHLHRFAGDNERLEISWS